VTGARSPEAEAMVSIVVKVGVVLTGGVQFPQSDCGVFITARLVAKEGTILLTTPHSRQPGTKGKSLSAIKQSMGLHLTAFTYLKH
jgi:hypothetical protein